MPSVYAHTLSTTAHTDRRTVEKASDIKRNNRHSFTEFLTILIHIGKNPRYNAQKPSSFT